MKSSKEEREKFAKSLYSIRVRHEQFVLSVRQSFDRLLAKSNAKVEQIFEELSDEA